MKKFAELAAEHLKKKGVHYGDARCIQGKREAVMVQGDKLDNVLSREDMGIGIRVLDQGAWGFAATSDMSEEAVVACADKAIEIARASALTTITPVKLDERDAVSGQWQSPRERDPFEVPLDEKIGLLLNACRELKKDSRIFSAKGEIKAIGEIKHFADTTGTSITQDILHMGGGIITIAESGGQVQTVSYPSSHGGSWVSGGYEHIEQLNFAENAQVAREHALELLDAAECPVGEFDLIITGPQLALQIHESCGHPTELDRALGTEISLAGGSFMQPGRLGKLKYGSEKVNLYGDSTIPGGLGSFGWDDEGVPAQQFDLVKDGLFVGYQTSRETAAIFGGVSNGTMRADGWSRIPLIRMSNINLAPDPDGPTLEELIADTKRGIYLDVNKSWSIDDLRLNFSFGCESGILIENGKRAGRIKNPVYTAITPAFWGSCDAVCNGDSWKVYGLPNCGKGHPSQTMRVGHGCSAARFRNVTVGRMK